MIINFGSINIDHVYRVQALPVPGETVIASSYEKFLGGKGVNQAVALAKAAGALRFVGAVGPDGLWVLEQIKVLGVEAGYIQTLECPTGHAIIFVDDNGENQIVIEGGANRQLTEALVDNAFDRVPAGQHWVLLQNEINLAGYIVEQARSRGFLIAYAAAPFVAETVLKLLDKIDLLAVNEGEADALASALGVEAERIPVPRLLITKGSAGARYICGAEMIFQEAFSVKAIDTTGAGDTFLGSFLAGFATDGDEQSALEYAAAASALQVQRQGAAIAIPEREEVLKFIQESNTNG